MEPIKPGIIDASTCQKLIVSIPCFETLNTQQSADLAGRMHAMQAKPGEVVVTEDALVDSIYIIVNGEAEVSRLVKHGKKAIPTPVAMLHAGESIGLNDTGFYSDTGMRKATVTALTDMQLLRLDIKDLYQFLEQFQLETSMQNASQSMQRMRLIKQSLPFSKISPERLQWLADKVEELSLPAGATLFYQGETGDCCYLICSGKIEILHQDENHEERQLAILKEPALIGEAILIASVTRNATARTLEPCQVLVLKNHYLSELLETEANVANMFMSLMVDRSRPTQNPEVIAYHRSTQAGEDITILKNPTRQSYFKLSREGDYIWQKLNGKNTLQDITLDVASAFNVFAPDMVVSLISKLNKAGFIANLDMQNQMATTKQPIWVRAMMTMQRLLDKRFAIGDADQWITKLYQRYIHTLFTKVGLMTLFVLILAGFITFIYKTSPMLSFFNGHKMGLLLILALVPLSIVEFALHELGHAFTVKYFGREVHYMGVGWTFSGPLAFTDTSDMWLAPRKPRMIVNLAGIVVDLTVAGIASLLIFLIPNHYIQAVLWLFALYTYIGSFRMLSPLQDMDGYYLLVDYVEKNHLRHASVSWLIKKFPRCLREPRLFREYRAELIYWISCIIYLAAVTILTLVLQSFIFKILNVSSPNHYVSLILPFIVVVFTSLSIIAEVKSQAE